MGVMEYICKTVLLWLVLEHGSHRKLWDDLQVDCGWMIKGYMKLTVKHKALLTLCTQPWFLGSLFPGKSLWSFAHLRGTSAQCSASGWKMARDWHDLLGKHVGREQRMREGVSCLWTAAKDYFTIVFYSGPPVSKRSAGTGKRERMAMRVVSLQSTSTWRTNNKEIFSLEEDILGREKGYG